MPSTAAACRIFTAGAGRLEDFYFIEKEAPDEHAQIILDLAASRIPARFGLDPVDDIQVLCPMYRGVIGVERLNRSCKTP